MTNPQFPIVGIGASAGGLEAFHGFFEHMPADSGMAFVVILHLPADRKSILPEILARWTKMRVREGLDGTPIEANTVYVPPPHAIVTLTERKLAIQMPEQGSPRNFRPIDIFFDSLAASLQEHAVGIVLSGTGSDGSLGLKAIKTSGGLTIAQGSGAQGPQYGQMPMGAIATGTVDLVCPVEEIPRHLLRMGSTRLVASEHAPHPAHEAQAQRLEICAILRAQLGHDFSGYRDKTFLRRVQRRMQVVNVATLDEYITELRVNSDEAIALFRDLLIRVTSFFRDKDTFATLESVVIPRLFEGKQADGTVRVWVPGCATGEEAYSLAILLREHMDRLSGPPKVQIFATDIDDAAISTARLGFYPETLIAGLSTERRERFFSHGQRGYRAAKSIRDLCTFSTHNLVRDPPFSRMNLISCRNLLIYFNSELQASIIPVFHYALAANGILLLGSSESVTKHADLFEPLDKGARIFGRRDGKSPPLQLAQLAAASDGQSPVAKALERPTRFVHASPASADRARNGNPERQSPSDITESQKLQYTLVGTQEELEALAEEHQTALEELRSSNEELHSVNEEMQSTNEELETAKEELQSVNEELNTVNAQLTQKVNELDQVNADLRNLLDSTQIATIFLDQHLIIRSFTPALGALYNLIPSDLGRPLTDIVSRLDYKGLRDDVHRVLEALHPLERRISREDRSTHYIMRILPYRGPENTVDGVVITFIDVTSIVQAEDTLREADLRKDVFLATLSHELRNPLAPIRNAVQLLQGKNLEPAQSRAQAIISRQVGHMSSLLDDLLDVARITRGSFLLKKTYVDLNDVLDEAVEEAQPLIDAKRHTLRVQRSAGPIVLEVDSVRIIQVVSNLLTNAAKYTPAGGEILLGSRLETDGVQIFVRDSGVGLTPEAIGQIFLMFSRVESEVGRSEGGLGIGLALAKGLAELHGGRVKALSAGLGEGSEFILSLPRSVITPQSLQPPINDERGPSMVSRRVLIADDNYDGAETLGLVLEMRGHEIHVTHSGEEALGVAARFRPEVCILDIGMPDLSGYEVAKRLRHEAWGAQITLIAVTGWGQESDISLAHAAGFDHHFTKPVDPERLAELLGATDGGVLHKR